MSKTASTGKAQYLVRGEAQLEPTIVLDSRRYRSLRQTNGSSKYIKIHVERHDISKLSFTQVMFEAIEVSFRQMVELGLNPTHTLLSAA